MYKTYTPTVFIPLDYSLTPSRFWLNLSKLLKRHCHFFESELKRQPMLHQIFLQNACEEIQYDKLATMSQLQSSPPTIATNAPTVKGSKNPPFSPSLPSKIQSWDPVLEQLQRATSDEARSSHLQWDRSLSFWPFGKIPCRNQRMYVSHNSLSSCQMNSQLSNLFGEYAKAWPKGA